MKHGRYYTISLYGINSFDVRANSHDRIHVRLNENERMGTKNEWRTKTWRKRGVDEQRRVAKNKENGIDVV